MNRGQSRLNPLLGRIRLDVSFLCKMTSVWVLRSQSGPGNMVVFSLGLVPAQAFPAPAAPRRRIRTRKTEGRY